MSYLYECRIQYTSTLILLSNIIVRVGNWGNWIESVRGESCGEFGLRPAQCVHSSCPARLLCLTCGSPLFKSIFISILYYIMFHG